MPQLHID